MKNSFLRALHFRFFLEEGFSYKNLCNKAISYFVSYCFTLAFISAEIIFHNFFIFQHYLKNYFLHEFSFINVFTQTISPPSLPKSTKHEEIFLSMFPYQVNGHQENYGH